MLSRSIQVKTFEPSFFPPLVIKARFLAGHWKKRARMERRKSRSRPTAGSTVDRANDKKEEQLFRPSRHCKKYRIVEKRVEQVVIRRDETFELKLSWVISKLLALVFHSIDILIFIYSFLRERMNSPIFEKIWQVRLISFLRKSIELARMERSSRREIF